MLKLPHGAQVSATGLKLPKALDFDQWTEIGDTLGKSVTANLWALGDWWARGGEYGARAEAVAKSAIPFSLGYLMNLGSVARRVTTSCRREVLTVSHHEVVARIAPKDQKEWLAKAATGKWSVARLRKEIQSIPPGDDDSGERSDDGEPADDPKEHAEKWVSKFLAEIKRRGPPTPSGDIADISDHQRDEIIKACSDRTQDWAEFTEGLKSLPERIAPSRVASIVTDEPNEVPVEQAAEKSEPAKKETVH